ncbi:MAG: hypothetical protein GY832_20610 [Chloroflexi bacterium]|nr:hypothetical protein [Chloroflexota bacterium]
MIKKNTLILLGVLVLLAMTTTAAWASGEIAPLGQDEGGTTDALWTTLAPLIAIATFIERALEVFWERWESTKLWSAPDSKWKTKSEPGYVMWKKARSQWLGTLVALIAIGLTNVRFFRLLGFEVLFSSPDLILFNAGIGGILDNFTVGTLIDWVLTAAIVGWGGTELTHSVIEGLVKGRGLWKEMREVEAGRKSILDAKFFNDYVVPRLEERGVSATSLRQAVQTMNVLGVPVDSFISSMTIGEADKYLAKFEADPDKAEDVQALRTFLEGVPPEKSAEIPNILNLLTSEQRKRFLGA